MQKKHIVLGRSGDNFDMVLGMLINRFGTTETEVLTHKLDQVGVSCLEHEEMQVSPNHFFLANDNGSLTGNIGELSTKHGIFSNNTG